MPAVEYEAIYRFENKTRRSANVKLGFPVITYAHRAGDSYVGLSSFGVTFGGKKVPVKEISQSRSSIYAKVDLSGAGDDLLAAGFAKAIPISSDFVDLHDLGSNKTAAVRKLRTSKKLPVAKIDNVLKALDKSVFGDNDESVRGQCLVWYSFDLLLPVGKSEPLTVTYTSLMPVDDEYSINYVLRTARYWGGPIGALDITFKPDEKFLQSGGRYRLFPKGKFQLLKGQYLYSGKMSVPDSDIQIRRWRSK